jgi:hypothetical protein
LATGREAHLPDASDCPSLPAASSIGIVSATDQRSRLASLPVGLLFLEPLGTKCQYDSITRYSQMNFALAGWFSSTLFYRILLQLHDIIVELRVDKTEQPAFVCSNPKSAFIWR